MGHSNQSATFWQGEICAIYGTFVLCGKRMRMNHILGRKRGYLYGVQGINCAKTGSGSWFWSVAERPAYLQNNFHVESASNGIVAVGIDLAESETAIHCDRIFHDGLNGVETHALITDRAGFGDDAIGEGAA
jgi:hypothetical protein